MRSTTRQCHDRQRGLRCAVAAVLCAVAMSLGAPAQASSTVAPPVIRMAQAENGISLEEAARRVREQTGGQVLRAETKRDKGRTVHRIRVLTEDGLVRTWRVDAETGEIY
jgi:uncharacterized membrane protein YkoI